MTFGFLINRTKHTGTGVIAQLGVLVTVIPIWITVLRNDIILFSGHPLAQSLGVVAVVQSILVLQPTHTASQKRLGQLVHAGLHLFSLVALVAGTVVIEYNKISNGLSHFRSPHAYIGVATLAVLALQYLVGFTMWATPALYGGESGARAVWKYHRWSGYFALVLLMASVVSSAKTDLMEKVQKLDFYLVLAGCALILMGVIPRIKKQKLKL